MRTLCRMVLNGPAGIQSPRVPASGMAGHSAHWRRFASPSQRKVRETLPRTVSILAQRFERLLDLDLRSADHLAPLLDLITLQHGERSEEHTSELQSLRH